MPVIVKESGTTVDEVADGVYRISTPVPPSPELPPGFSFNQYLIADDEPVLYHTGLRGLFSVTRAAVASVMPVEKLRYIALSHVEADECGALNEFLSVAPHARPLCSDIAAMVSIGDLADRPPHAMGDGDTLDLGGRRVTWTAAPHLPHGWDCGHLFDHKTGALFCGDLFTQPGAQHRPLTEDDILEPSEQMRGALDYYSHTKHSAALMEKLAALEPKVLACMHGAAWSGDGAALLRELGRRLEE